MAVDSHDDTPQMTPEANRTRVKDWYNANVDRVRTTQALWIAKNRKRINHRRRERRRLRRPTCQIVGCNTPMRKYGKKFCLRDSLFFSKR